MFRWKPGRVGTGYFTCRLWQNKWPVKFDVYIVKYPEGSYIPPHTDPSPVSGKRHFRFNYTFWLPKICGGFAYQGTAEEHKHVYYRSKRITFFRPDIIEHEVMKVVEGTRYVLSIGWLRT
jgi:hypothetical protein